MTSLSCHFVAPENFQLSFTCIVYWFRLLYCWRCTEWCVHLSTSAFDVMHRPSVADETVKGLICMSYFLESCNGQKIQKMTSQPSSTRHALPTIWAGDALCTLWRWHLQLTMYLKKWNLFKLLVYLIWSPWNALLSFTSLIVDFNRSVQCQGLGKCYPWSCSHMSRD